MNPFLAGSKVSGESTLAYPVLKADLFTQAVFPSLAIGTGPAHNHRFDCHPVPGLHFAYAFSNLSHFPSNFMSGWYGERGCWMRAFEDV